MTFTFLFKGRYLVGFPQKATLFLSFLSLNFDHHLRCSGWLNFEFNKRENTHAHRAGPAISERRQLPNDFYPTPARE